MNPSSQKRLGVVLAGLATLLILGIAYLLGVPEGDLALITLLGLIAAVTVVLTVGRISS